MFYLHSEYVFPCFAWQSWKSAFLSVSWHPLSEDILNTPEWLFFLCCQKWQQLNFSSLPINATVEFLFPRPRRLCLPATHWPLHHLPYDKGGGGFPAVQQNSHQLQNISELQSLERWRMWRKSGYLLPGVKEKEAKISKQWPLRSCEGWAQSVLWPCQMNTLEVCDGKWQKSYFLLTGTGLCGSEFKLVLQELAY